MRVMSWATQDWRAAWALSESSSSTSHLTAWLASTTTDPLTPTISWPYRTWPSDLPPGYLFTELHTKGLANDSRHIRR